jgi:hypothetical protein
MATKCINSKDIVVFKINNVEYEIDPEKPFEYNVTGRDSKLYKDGELGSIRTPTGGNVTIIRPLGFNPVKFKDELSCGVTIYWEFKNGKNARFEQHNVKLMAGEGGGGAGDDGFVAEDDMMATELTLQYRGRRENVRHNLN